MKQWYESLFEDYAHKYDKEPFVQGTVGECDFIEQEVRRDKSLKVLDIGCGTGYFTIPAIDIVSTGGVVYGLDTSQEMLDMLKDRLGPTPPSTLSLVKTGEYEFNLQPRCATFAFMCNVLHEVDDPGRLINAVLAILAPGGRFALIDWVRKSSDFGPPEAHRLEQSFVEQLLEAGGLDISETGFIGEEFFSLVSVLHQ